MGVYCCLQICTVRIVKSDVIVRSLCVEKHRIWIVWASTVRVSSGHRSLCDENIVVDVSFKEKAREGIEREC